MFPEEENLYYTISYLCSNVCFKFLSCLAPTVNFQVGNIASLPFKISDDKKIRNRIDKLVKENIEICKEEWSFYETNIEFKMHPFVIENLKDNKLDKTVQNFEKYYNSLRNSLRKNEEELNHIFSSIFEVEGEIDCSVNDRDLTIKPFNKIDWIKSYLSYLVGVSVGRYDIKNKKSDYSKCKYEINFDRIIDFIQKNMSKDDIEYVEKNLNFSIPKFYQKEFMKYHEKIYQNHPIYYTNSL